MLYAYKYIDCVNYVNGRKLYAACSIKTFSLENLMKMLTSYSTYLMRGPLRLYYALKILVSILRFITF